jgi:hypothetical protein
VFAAFKLIATLFLACASVLAAIAESRHPMLFACLCAAFVAGAIGSELLREHRSHTVRSFRK